MKWKLLFWMTLSFGVLLAVSLYIGQRQPERVITILGEDSSNLNAYATLGQDFTKKTGIKVRFEKVSFDQLAERAEADFRNGTAKYDIVLNYNFSLAPYVTNKYVVEMGSPTSPIPLRNLSANEDMFENALRETSFYYSIPDDPSSNPAQFGLPFAANTMLLVYNKELFDDPDLRERFRRSAGRDLTPPVDWNQYIETAEFFSTARPGLYGVAMQGASGDWLYYEMANYLFGMGTGTSDKKYGWEQTKLTLVSPQNEEVLRFMKRLRRTSSGDFFTTDASKQQALMLEGRTAMALMWSDYVFPLAQSAFEKKKKPRFEFLPTPGTRSGLAGGAFYINKASKNIEGATQFVLFALGPQNQRKMMQYGLCSPLQSAYTDDVYSRVPYAKALRDSLARGTFMFEAGTDASIISGALTTAVQRYMRDEISEAETLRQASSEIISKRQAAR
jgi:ABC-type glycerol-3-phosphate transport system substrate-binding protein